MATPTLSEIFQSPSTLSQAVSQAVVVHHGQIDMVIRLFFVKWWDTFYEERIIRQVQKEFPVSLTFSGQALMTSKVVPLMDMLSPEPKDKAKVFTNGSKSTRSKSSPTEYLNIKNVKKCSNSDLRMLARVLNERLSELYEDED